MEQSWSTELAKTIRDAPVGTVIMVDTSAKKELAERAIFRLGRTGELEVQMKSESDSEGKTK